MQIPFLSNLYKKIEKNPTLIFPVISGSGSIAIGVILQMFFSLPRDLLFGLAFLLAFSMIIYQIMSCNGRVKEITSHKEHYKKLKDLYTKGEISSDTFVERMNLLELYEDDNN